MHECPRGVETLRRVRGKCRRQDPAHRLAFVRGERCESAFLYRAAEPAAGQQFVRDGADRVDVGGRAPGAAVAALRRGVRVSNGRLQTCLMQRQRNSDPGDADGGSIALQKHIARVQGAVADPRLPGRIDHLRQRPKKIDGALERHGREVAQAEFERLTGDIVGRKIRAAAFLPGGKNIDRGAMVDRAIDDVSEGGSQPRHVFRNDVERDRLDRDQAIVNWIVRAKHGTENAAADLVEHEIRTKGRGRSKGVRFVYWQCRNSSGRCKKRNMPRLTVTRSARRR
jgi:hypothetical protein